MGKGLWQEVPRKKRHLQTKTGGGIHTGLPQWEIPVGMAADMENIHSGAYPHLSPRPPRDGEKTAALPEGAVRFFGTIFGTRLAAVVGRNLYTYEGACWEDRGALFTASEGRVYAADFMDYTVFADGAECKKFDGETISSVGTQGKPENALFLTTHAWHLFTASDKDKFLRYCAVENIEDWSAPTDAGQELVETSKEAYAGGLTAYGGHVIYFKKNAMFELYGTDPVNFSLLCLSRDIGCISQGSIAEIGGILYFAGADGIYRYSGGKLPVKISFPIQKYIDGLDTEKPEQIVAGGMGERYYISLPQKDGETVLLTFDTRVSEWYKEDGLPFIGFTTCGDTFYGATAEGKVYAFGEGSERVAWYTVLGPYTLENAQNQNWHRIFIRADLEEGASFAVALSPWAGGEGFRTVGTMTESGQVQIEVPPKMQDAPQMRIRIAGEGRATISALEFEGRSRKRSYI